MDEYSYQASLTRAAFYLQEKAGIIRISGPDRSVFIQRQTTGDVRLLSPERGVLSVLTSPTARILDVFYLVGSPEGQDGFVDLVTLPGHGQATASYLKSRIFFNDKVTVEEYSSSFLQMDLLGPEAPRILNRAFGIEAGEANSVVQTTLEGFHIQALSMENNIGLGWRLIFPSDAQSSVFAKMDQEEVLALDENTYEVRRIEEGLPAAGKELTDAYTPLEVNLITAVSDNKGCYTGQEVIARQITYDKVTRRLTGLNLGEVVSPGAEVRAEDRVVGTVTSAVVSPRFGPIALSVLKRPHFEPGTSVSVDGKSRKIPGTTQALPFL
jgi:tRNA-modifying protein YgfZ